MKIPIVNEQDEIIGYKERDELDAKDICRVSALWVNDKEGNILLAQRAFSKKTNPGMCGPAVSGTVEEGETYEQNIIKEAKEEIGLIDHDFIFDHKKMVSANSKYFLHWSIVVVDRNYPFIKQDEEVETIRWFSKDEILKFLEEKPEMFHDSFKSELEYFSLK